MKNKRYTYFSVDIETGGTIAGLHPLLSIGVVAYDEELQEIGTFYVNIDSTQTGFTFLESTMEWWKRFPAQWEQATQNPVQPVEAMTKLVRFVESCCWYGADGEYIPRAIPVFVAKPVKFDIPFIALYLEKYIGKGDLIRSTIDLRSLIMGVYSLDYSDSHPNSIDGLKEIGTKNKNAHNALDDARMQGEQFVQVYSEMLLKGMVYEDIAEKMFDDSSFTEFISGLRL